MTEGQTKPTICLNMIVKNESHIVHELLDTVAPYIDYWVIVDTGSDDGTQDYITAKMAELGIPGELHERPWRDFGQNRSEALVLAQGHADYIWVMDADDTLEGTLHLDDLTADCYEMRIFRRQTFWRRQLFRDGLAWRYQGVLHELAVCDEPFCEERLAGDYRIISRSLGVRSRDPLVYQKDCDMLLAQIEKHPDDDRSVFYLAMTLDHVGRDYVKARPWWQRYVEIGTRDQMRYYAMFKLAETMEKLGEPWPKVQDAYLRAWAYRLTRAEALHAIAVHYRASGQYVLGYQIAARAAEIPAPLADQFFVHDDVYQWRAADEQAVCASWLAARQGEALRIWRRLLTLNEVPDDDRRRMLRNRDLVAGQLVESCAAYSSDQMQRLVGSVDAEVSVSVVAGPDVSLTEATINSFLRCCTDSTWVGRFLIVQAGLTAEGRGILEQRYPFLDFISSGGRGMAGIREQIGGRYWLNLRQGWRFFTEESLVIRLIGVFSAEPEVSAVGINLGDAAGLSAESPARDGVSTTPTGDRYVVTDNSPAGPVMYDLSRPENGRSATLDEVLCIRQ